MLILIIYMVILSFRLNCFWFVLVGFCVIINIVLIMFFKLRFFRGVMFGGGGGGGGVLYGRVDIIFLN